MTYQEIEKTKLRRESSKQAIALAMKGRWWEAVAANKSVIENFPNDVDAYNRLGRAYMALGEYALAREAYEKAVENDPYNTIARKNLNRLAHLAEDMARSEAVLHNVEPQQFIEETGKSGVVRLYHLAPPEVLAKMVAGTVINLKVEGQSLVVENSRGEYLGQVEPKHAQRLAKLIEGGNKYGASIVSSTEDAVTAIVREVYQDPSQIGKLSFPPKGTEGFRPYAEERVLRRELEYEETAPEEPGYTIVGGDETEVLTEEPAEEEEEEE